MNLSLGFGVAVVFPFGTMTKKTLRMPSVHSDTFETLWNSPHHHFNVNTHKNTGFFEDKTVFSNKNCSESYNPFISVKASHKIRQFFISVLTMGKGIVELV